MQRQRFLYVVAFSVPVLLALALGALGLYASARFRKEAARIEALEQQAAAGYAEALYQLSDNVNDMQAALKKLQVTGSMAQHVTLLSDVWRLSGAAVANMGLIPDSHADTYALNQFLVRIGDYAAATNRRILNGAVLTGDDYAVLGELYEASVRVGNDLTARIDGGEMPVSALDVDGYYGAAAAAANAAQTAGAGGGGTAEGEGESGGEGESKSEDSIPNYPTLIYDGPFSESNEQRAPLGLPEGEIDALAARRIAIGYVGGGALNDSGEEGGAIPVYAFTGSEPGGRAVEITVSKQGGQVLWMMAETPGGADGVPDGKTAKRMRDAAQTFLDERGYAAMEPTYAQYYNGVGVFNFAAVQDGVILYSDLVKVYVEKATCAVVGADALHYLMCHRARTLPNAQLTQAEASVYVSDGLDVRAVRLALIPVTPSTETLCWEFKGTWRGASFIVYINAATGAETQIFEIIDSEDGQLVV